MGDRLPAYGPNIPDGTFDRDGSYFFMGNGIEYQYNEEDNLWYQTGVLSSSEQQTQQYPELQSLSTQEQQLYYPESHGIYAHHSSHHHPAPETYQHSGLYETLGDPGQSYQINQIVQEPQHYQTSYQNAPLETALTQPQDAYHGAAGHIGVGLQQHLPDRSQAESLFSSYLDQNSQLPPEGGTSTEARLHIRGDLLQHTKKRAYSEEALAAMSVEERDLYERKRKGKLELEELNRQLYEGLISEKQYGDEKFRRRSEAAKISRAEQLKRGDVRKQSPLVSYGNPNSEEEKSRVEQKRKLNAELNAIKQQLREGYITQEEYNKEMTRRKSEAAKKGKKRTEAHPSLQAQGIQALQGEDSRTVAAVEDWNEQSSSPDLQPVQKRHRERGPSGANTPSGQEPARS